MKKLFYSILFFLLCVGLTKAQTNNISVGAGLEVAFPTGGSFSNSSTTGFGPSATVDYELHTLPLTLTGYLGYLHFGSKSGQNAYASYTGASANVVPLLGGVKYYFVPGIGVYGTALLGVEFFSFNSSGNNSNVTTYTGFNYPNPSPSQSKFTFAIGGGYELPLNIPGVVDLSAKYMIISDANYFSLRAGYIYKF